MQMTQPHTRRSERTTPLRATMGDRIGAGVLALVCLAVLSLSAWLNPSDKGHGTHTQLGLSPCMWAVTLDKPCPTCGMTTSFSHAGQGNWFESIKTQPMGSLLVLMSTMVFWGALVQTISGARIYTMIDPALRPRNFLIFGVLFLLAWFYKVVTW